MLVFRCRVGVITGDEDVQIDRSISCGMRVMSLRLNVLDAAARSLALMLRESPKWLSVICLPWLLGSVIYTYAAYAVPNAFQIGALPNWLGGAIFLPFSAIVICAVLNNIIHRKPCGFRSMKLSEDTARIALALLAVLLADLAVEFVKDQAISTYANNQIAAGFTFSPEETQRFLGVLSASVWFANCVATTLIYPMMPIVVERRGFDFTRWLTLLKRHGLRFFSLTVVLAAAYKGFEQAYTAFLIWTKTLPFPDGSGIMRDFLLRQFTQLLVYFPVDFVAEILPAVTAGTVYVALLSRSDPHGE